MLPFKKTTIYPWSTAVAFATNSRPERLLPRRCARGRLARRQGVTVHPWVNLGCLVERNFLFSIRGNTTEPDLACFVFKVRLASQAKKLWFHHGNSRWEWLSEPRTATVWMGQYPTATVWDEHPALQQLFWCESHGTRVVGSFDKQKRHQPYRLNAIAHKEQAATVWILRSRRKSLPNRWVLVSMTIKQSFFCCLGVAQLGMDGNGSKSCSCLTSAKRYELKNMPLSH